MSLIIRTDVTAVNFYKNFILAGIGSYLNVFNKESTKLLHRIHVLEGQKVYGIVSSSCGQKILVFGGKQFTILAVETSRPCDNDVVVTRLWKSVICDDWLHSALWINEESIALLTAHNVVQKWDTNRQVLLSQHQSRDNSILYSGLVLPMEDDVLVLAGTVFSEVIIHCCKEEKPLHHLVGHRGVIFSISCDAQRGIIVTTSDDRSVRIWSIHNPKNFLHNTNDYWQEATITCSHEVYGHMARVMRSCITRDHIVSVGEDSGICFWDTEGILIRKILSHQNGCIWSVDNDETDLVTGGGDCGIILHPMTVATDYGNNEILEVDVGTPKKIIFTSRRNLVILNEADLIYYDFDTKSKMVYKLNHESTYKLISITSCKQIIAVADMNGKLDVFVENCKDSAYLQSIINTRLQIGKILSMQWAGNRHLVLCSENGFIKILTSIGTTLEVYANFMLPTSKERWLTASAIDGTSNIVVLGDRCGNIHIYAKGQRDPLKTFNKVHGRYGPTSISARNNEFITTGRDGSIKYFLNYSQKSTFKYMCSKEIEFQWVEKFLDKNENIVCGFQERIFVVYNVKSNCKLLEVPCGGGHRSWDSIRYISKINDGYKEFVRLVYLKNADIHITTFQMNKIISRNVVNGSHAKEINCLKAYKTNAKDKTTFYITGGEDTTLRISSINADLQFRDEVIFKQLSSVRTLRICSFNDNQLLLLSAGGRAQICVRKVTFENVSTEIKLSSEVVVDYLIKGTDKERKGNQTWRNCSIDFDPETRIMDIDFIKLNDNDFVIFAGCSDACLRIFMLSNDSKQLKPIKEMKHHKTCILKINCLKFLEKDILVTCSTRGEITFWDISSMEHNLFDAKPIFTTTSNKSGINCFASKILSDSYVLIATGGDDNSLHLKVIEIPDQHNFESMKVSHKWSSDKLHSSQITGVCLLDDIVISTSIDQRITLYHWTMTEQGISCEFLSQTFSDVADIQGMDMLDSSSEFVTVCVFGKGMEVVTLSKHS